MPPVESVDSSTRYKISDVLDSKVVKARGRLRQGQTRETFIKYRVGWEGFRDRTWELAADVVPAAYDRVTAFHRRYPAKPRPEGLELPFPVEEAHKHVAPIIEEDMEDVLGGLEDDIAFARAYAQRTSRFGGGGVMSRTSVPFPA